MMITGRHDGVQLSALFPRREDRQVFVITGDSRAWFSCVGKSRKLYLSSTHNWCHSYGIKRVNWKRVETGVEFSRLYCRLEQNRTYVLNLFLALIYSVYNLNSGSNHNMSEYNTIVLYCKLWTNKGRVSQISCRPNPLNWC